MAYDVDALRSGFPALNSGVAYFDTPGGSQVPDVVAGAIADTLRAGLSNRGRVTASERAADDVVLGARSAMADLLGADPGGIVFGRSMTQLTYDFARTIAKTWSPGDEVVVTRLDHDANIRPWVQAAAAVGATVRWADFDPGTGELTTDDINCQLSERTRLVAVTGASNLIGTRPRWPTSPAPCTIAALSTTSTVCTWPRTSRSMCRRSAQICSSARRTSSSGRTAGCWPPGVPC